MKLAIIGTGYVGLSTGACFAEYGHEVICVDIDEQKIENLKAGVLPIYEPGLDELVLRNMKEGRLSFSTDSISSIRSSDVVFSAVGTPSDADARADLMAVKAVAKTFAQALEKHTVFVMKSTVPVGTSEVCKTIIQQELGVLGKENVGFDMVSNPEFLREGCAIADTMTPERIVVGVDSDRAKDVMERVYAPICSVSKSLLLFTNIPSAELIKYASNGFLATKISYINEIANFCEATGADVIEVSKGMGLDSRIGRRFLHAGIGYGGSCFPKDVQALIRSGEDFAYSFDILRAVDKRNDSQKVSLVKKVFERFPDVMGKTFAVWGLSFKPKTDDVRDAPSLEIIEKLCMAGAIVKAYDPVAMQKASAHVRLAPFIEKGVLQLVSHSQDVFKGASALLLLTEWNEFRSLNYEHMRDLMEEYVVFDGRNIYSPDEVVEAGFEYVGVGRVAGTGRKHRSVQVDTDAIVSKAVV